MSDDNGDAAPMGADEAGSRGDVGGLPATTDESMAGRLDTIHRTVSTLGMRIDALVTSTTSYRSAMTDRLTEYADLVSKLTRTQASDLEEYRRANERAIADLRRSLSGSDELMERVGARIDSLLTDSESADDQSRRTLTEVRSLLDSQEKLSSFLTESLDQFGDRVVERMGATQQSVLDQVAALRSDLAADEDREAALHETLAPLREGIERIESALSDTSQPDELAGRLGALDERIALLVERDPSAGLADRLAELDGRLRGLVPKDPAVALAGQFDTLHAAVGLLATAEQVGGLSAEIRAHVVDAIGAQDSEGVVDQLSRIERELTSSGQVAAESWGEFAGLRAKVDAILETTAHETGSLNTLLDEVREALIDVASGEVVGALWDEFRATRSSIELLVSDAETNRVLLHEQSTDSNASGALASEAIERLRVDVSTLSEAVRDLLAQAEVVDDVADGRDADAAFTAMAADVAALRNELSEGLVVEPSDALASTVDQLRDDLAALDERLDSVSNVERQLIEMRDMLEARPAPDDADSVSSADLEGELQVLRTGVETVDADLRTMRTGIEDIIARLDEGLVLADDITAPAASPSPEVADQLATLRDQVATEFDAMRRLVSSAEPGAPAASSDGQYATIDPDTVDLLREEIRTAGSVSEEVVDALRKELVALRRRIKLRAEGEIFSANELEAIAEAVARRLAD